MVKTERNQTSSNLKNSQNKNDGRLNFKVLSFFPNLNFFNVSFLIIFLDSFSNLKFFNLFCLISFLDSQECRNRANALSNLLKHPLTIIP